jgi:hypothetical protein
MTAGRTGGRRGGLIEMVDRYLDALAARDPGRLPLHRGVAFTENGQRLELGRGLWATATGVPDRDCAHVEDPDLGQVAWMGVVHEGERAAVAFLRLRVEDELIAEIETIVRREGPRLYDPAHMQEPRPIVFERLDRTERSARERLIAIGHGYFDGIERLDAGLISVRDDCRRIENGSQTVLVADVAPDAGRTAKLILPMSIRAQVESGYVAYVEEIRDRRVVAVDEARGLVLFVVVFDHPARMRSVPVSGAGEVELPRTHQFPNSALIAELFKVRSGQIEHIEAVLEVLPYGSRSGWDG